MEKPKVYFTSVITPASVSALYDRVCAPLQGRIAVKLHSGEQGNQNFLRPDFWQPLVDRIGGTVAECNTAYPGARNSSEKHKQLLQDHGWTQYFTVDLLDETGPDLALPVEHGHVLTEDFVGKNLANYDSLLVLSHFKGHPMGGFGGALKQLSIGCASSEGKAWIHSAGRTKDQRLVWRDLPEQDRFLESMADAASAVVRYFGGKAAYINVMKNLSVDCDCCAVAEDPCMADVGVLASLDPVALDQACIDLVYAAKDDPGQAHFLERIESRHGIHTVEAAAALGFGSREYALVNVDA
jgi:uncharacterized Fe-S center protein